MSTEPSELDKIRESVKDNPEDMESKLEQFTKRGEEVEKKAETTPATVERVERDLKNLKGGMFGGQVGPLQAGPPGQQGPLSFMVGHTKDLTKVVLDFKRPIQFLQFTPQEAFGLSKVLRKNAKKCRG